MAAAAVAQAVWAMAVVVPPTQEVAEAAVVAAVAVAQAVRAMAVVVAPTGEVEVVVVVAAQPAWKVAGALIAQLSDRPTKGLRFAALQLALE